MTLQVLLIAGYLLALLVLGLLARRGATRDHEGFFLANRRIGPVLMLLSMAATNFSAFTFLGFSGAGFRIGWSYYPIMAFGTGFMALTFVLIGVPVWRAAKKLGAITPPELIRLRFGNPALHAAYLVVMVVFTLPYLAIQPMGAGYALKGLLGIPYIWGAALVTLVGTGYVLLGGMKADVWTDALQGIVMLVAMTAAFLGIASALGGFSEANRQVLNRFPELFSRPGAGNAMPMGIWFSYMTLWFFCDPMFPQLFQRFMAARDARSLRFTAVAYPLVTAALFFLPVGIGVMGRLVVPDLAGNATDQVLPMVVARLLPNWLGAVVVAGGLAALMSTMDSQLLTLSSMVIRDGASLLRVPTSTFALRTSNLARNAVVLLLALAGLALAFKPWAPILQIATETFTGLAVLFPVTLAAIYWKKTNAWAGFASILAGEALVVLYHFKLLPAFGLLPVIPVLLATTLVLVLGSLLARVRSAPLTSHISHLTSDFSVPVLLPSSLAPRPSLQGWTWFAIFGFLFLLANDFWNWGKVGPIRFGLPAWMWYHIGLCLLLFILMAVAFRNNKETD